MPTTTATTRPAPALADAVRQRIRDLHDGGVREFTADRFTDLASAADRPAAWVTDHLIVLQGVGDLRAVARAGVRTWTVAPGSEILR
ncbi:hypothetical protein ABTY20_19015 [Streptomyces sp. NPDC126497]|uniref:hypothetical protein n=1 Tax=Streptomyces sp. NPDC126497 TaxID=3155313 RepID=UPI003331369E